MGKNPIDLGSGIVTMVGTSKKWPESPKKRPDYSIEFQRGYQNRIIRKLMEIPAIRLINGRNVPE
jgi:hypothetical protein